MRDERAELASLSSGWAGVSFSDGSADRAGDNERYGTGRVVTARGVFFHRCPPAGGPVRGESTVGAESVDVITDCESQEVGVGCYHSWRRDDVGEPGFHEQPEELTAHRWLDRFAEVGRPDRLR